LAKNPFEVFGLTPELVDDLTEKELFGVLKAVYRTLQKSYHPDTNRRKAPNPSANDKAVELNLAFEALDLERAPASFRKYRRLYLSRKPSNAQRDLLDLKTKLGVQLQTIDRLAENFLGYLAAGADWASVAKGPKLLPISIKTKNVCLGLSDVAITTNIKQSCWLTGTNYKQIDINSEGRLSVKAVGRARFAKADYIHLLGCVPVNKLDLPPILERRPSSFFKSPALNIGEGAKPKLSVANLISQDNFKRYVLFSLIPTFMERSYLFSLNRAEFENSGLITLEGVIVKIDLKA
jgi:hypothetical protein